MNEGQKAGSRTLGLEFSKIALLIQFALSVLLVLVMVIAFLLGKDISPLGMLTGGSVISDGAITSFYLWKSKVENRAKYAERFALKVAETYGIEAALQMAELVLKE